MGCRTAADLQRLRRLAGLRGPEVLFETTGCDEDEHAYHFGIEGVGVREAARCGYERTGGGLVGLRADENVIALQQVERLVFPAVDVARRSVPLGDRPSIRPYCPPVSSESARDGEQAT